MSLRPSKALDHWRSSILIAVLSLFILAACQAGPTLPTAVAEPTSGVDTPEPEVILLPSAVPTNPPTPTLADHLTVSASDLQGQKIQVWHPFESEVAGRFSEIVRKFNRSNEWGIQVEVRELFTTGELFDAVSAGFEDPETGLPDMLAAPSDQLVAWSLEKDAVVDLNEYIQHERFGLTASEWASINPTFVSQDQLGGEAPIQLGLPALRTADVLFYNVTWAKELGFDRPPQTPAEFKTQACAAAVENNRSRYLEMFGTGGWIIDSDASTTLSWLSAFGASPIPDQDGQPYRFDSEEAQAAFAYLRDLQNDGCAWLSNATAPYENFAHRKALFYSGGLVDIEVQAGWQALVNSQDEWTILSYPGQDGKPVLYASGYSYALFKQDDAQAQTAAWLFTRWLAQPDHAVKLAGALPSLPVSEADAKRLSSTQSELPWKLVLPISGAARAMPSLSSWREVHRLVEDAAWQIYHLPAESLPLILPQLDEAVEELVSQSQ